MHIVDTPMVTRGEGEEKEEQKLDFKPFKGCLFQRRTKVGSKRWRRLETVGELTVYGSLCDSRSSGRLTEELPT